MDVSFLSDIKPGIGLGKLQFGATREEVTQLLGSPDHSEITSTEEDSSSHIDAWVYEDLRLNLSFEEAENWRLTIISIATDTYSFKGSSLIGLNYEEALDELAILGIDDIEIELLPDEDGVSHSMVSSISHEINFWFINDVLEEIQWATFFDDQGNMVWPT